MDWRHVGELITAGERVYGETINLVTWSKSNAGQGSFHRSQHELIGVFREGDAASLNDIQLGRYGRNRSNVWHYAGVDPSSRDGAMRSRLTRLPNQSPLWPMRYDLHQAPRCGARHLRFGTTILAAERVGRIACASRLSRNPSMSPSLTSNSRVMPSMPESGPHLLGTCP